MFLSDKLVEIGRNADQTTKDGILNCLSSMIQECFRNISDTKGYDTNFETIQAQFKRVNRAWKEAAQKLENEEIYIIDSEGFENFVKNNEKFKGIKL